MLRWLWRFGVWTLLLWHGAQLPLQLVPTHPDRAGGIGFLTLFPLIFVPFTFVLSVVVASSALHEVVFAELAFETLRNAALLWVAFIAVLFVGPLVVFAGKLVALRETALIEYSETGCRYNRDAERRLREAQRQQLTLDADAISGISDIGAGLAAIQGIKVLPVELWALVPLLVATLLP